MTQPYAHPGPPGRPGAPQYPYPAPQPGPFRPMPPGYPVPNQPLGYRPLQRPAAVGLAATMAVTASLQWICVLGFAWLVATVGISDLSTDELGIDSAVYHLLHGFHNRMLDGLAVPLFGFPLAAFASGFLALVPRPWTRWALTLSGVAALAWSAWWLHRDIVWWIAPALYILVACLVLWTPGASAWYRARGRAVVS